MIVSRPLYRAFKPVAEEKIFSLRSGLATQYLDMKKLLIQGANPTNQLILDTHEQFQGGYRCVLKIITPPTLGHVSISDNHLGFDYTPLSTSWIGKDSFSYSVINCFGYESDAKCCFISIL